LRLKFSCREKTKDEMENKRRLSAEEAMPADANGYCEVMGKQEGGRRGGGRDGGTVNRHGQLSGG
jgi:hypothetical protein